VIYYSENILVTLDWFPSMNDLVSSDMKINQCSMSVSHQFSRSHKCGRLITFCWALGCDGCCRHCVRLAAALSRHCRFFFEVNTFLQMSQLSETTSGTVTEHARHVSMLNDTVVISEGLCGLVTIVT